jgi:DsbC/DsbD-like thiol-disulfide interchange protein
MGMDKNRVQEMAYQTEAELVLAREDLWRAQNGRGDLTEAQRAVEDCERRLHGLQISLRAGIRVYWSGSLGQFVTVPE